MASGVLDGVKVMLDPTGSQGLDLIPGWREIAAPIIDGIGGAGSAQQIANATKFPGRATYITYDSGNLPLLEPFNAVPRLLNIFPAFDVPTPVTDSVEDALRKMVNTGYQDVDPVTLGAEVQHGRPAGQRVAFAVDPHAATRRHPDRVQRPARRD